GSARTLMDTINNSVNDKDMHGRTSHLSAQEMQDLIEFLKAL
ncbi:MAG: hydrazine synthase subunit, partial [Planctomycetota bacterium]|nr:hydrazine synthase subunit [Planctomycetota bacterium]